MSTGLSFAGKRDIPLSVYHFYSLNSSCRPILEKLPELDADERLTVELLGKAIFLEFPRWPVSV